MDDFLTDEERAIGDAFMEKGWHRQQVENTAGLDRMIGFVSDMVKTATGQADLTKLHDHMPVSALNEFRLSAFHALNAEPWFRPAFYHVAKQALQMLVGNELVMQKRVNLSIQMPGDTSSVLPVHADTWSGDSAYEIVVWLPLVDVTGSMAMFLATPDQTAAVTRQFSDFSDSEAIFNALQPGLQWMEMQAGDVLLFNQQLPHGNRVNETDRTRWSLNCRFKSVLSPYADKKPGEFFEPISLKPMTRLGASWQMPVVRS